MKGTILEILVRIHQQVSQDDDTPELDEPSIIERLLVEGFSIDHIHRALEWRDGFFDRMPQVQPTTVSAPLATRIYTPEESQKINCECRDFIQKLENRNIVDIALREFIIEQAMELDMDYIKTPYFIWIVYTALDNQADTTQDISWLEEAIYECCNQAETVH